MTDDQRENLERVYRAIAAAIMEFYHAGPTRSFHVEELRLYVRERVALIAPDSPGRILRQLRLDGSLDYVVLNRRQSLYQFRRPEEEQPMPPATASTAFGVSQSKVSQWRRCKLAFHFQHREHLRPKVKSRPLYFGSTVHSMLQAVAEGRDARSALAEIAHRDEPMFREERDYFVKLIEDINFIFRAYKKFWAEAPLVFVPIGNRNAEVPFAVKIDDAIEVKGTIDGIVSHKSFNWLLEHKTHKEFPSADHRWRNLQGAVYNSISRLLGWPKLQGVCWNYVRSKEPTRPKILKSGKLSIKDLDTLPEVVLEVLEEHRLNPRDYADFIAAQEANLPTWFERVWTPVQEHVVKTLWREFRATAREMADYYTRTEAPPPRTIDHHCTWCPYEKLCRAELQGLDVDGVKQLDYVFDDTPYQRGQAAA
jgi:PD-(D/E)XK nuclease superfamily